MKIRLLMPSVASGVRLQFSVSALIDDRIAVDTGGLPYLGSVEEQRKVEHVFLTHSHIDHVGGLPIFLDNIYTPDAQCPTVYAGEATWNCLEQDLFNDRIWPNLERIAGDEFPFYSKQIVDAQRPLRIGNLLVTPIPLEHVVPTLGYVVEGETGSVLLAWDTAPFLEFGAIIESIPNLKAVFLDASFPNQMQWLAEKSKHTTPCQVQRLAQAVPSSVRIIAVHLKPAFHAEVAAELQQLDLPNLEIACREKVYEI